MRLFLTSVLFVISLSASAQNYPMPGAQSDPAVICTGCPFTNDVGEANDGLPTVPYDTPLQLHAGRFVDSSSTTNQRNGMRTVRAGRVRVAPTTNRLYLGLGAAVGAYTLDTFFSGKLQEPMVAVNTIPTGKPYSGRNPYEKLAKPDRFFYAEHARSGWVNPSLDQFVVLNDFDADDRGYLYVGTVSFGWGIVTDPGGSDGSHLASKQVLDGLSIASIFSLRSGSSYYVFVSNTSTTAHLYDVTAPAAPVLLATRTGTPNAVRAWSKYEAGQRVAVRNIDGHVRVYTYADFIAGNAALIDVSPVSGRPFADLSFDDDGNLWLAETAGTSGALSNLWKLTPSATGYTTTTYSVYGNSSFAAFTIHASAGYIAVGGRFMVGSTVFLDVRLLRVVSGVPELLDTNDFFLEYYDRAPAGYAQPLWGDLQRVHILAQGGKTYLFYNTDGLGDVYELGSGSRITSMTPLTGIPAGGADVSIYGTGFAAGSTVTFGGVLASSTFVGPTQMTAVSPMHASGAVSVVVTPPGAAAMMAPKKFTYQLTTPQQFVATATSTTSVNMSWSSVGGATYYEVFRRSPDGTWSVAGSPSTNSFTDGGRTAETTYVYRVRAADAAANVSADSAMDLATTMSADSAVIVAGSLIRAADLTHLRTRVNAVRAAAGLSSSAFAGGAAGQPILATHITDLRGALNEARIALGFARTTFTDAAPAGIAVKALHFNQLLDAMR